MRKGFKLYSMLRWKCPRCHEGDLFNNPNPYDPSTIGDMPENCPNCGQKFLLEPGFYYGAMYVSYALTVALSVAVFVAMIVLWEFNTLWYLGLNALAIILCFPWIFRTSRAVWFNFFVSYQKGALKHD
jgi:ribosomal protein S27AE